LHFHRLTRGKWWWETARRAQRYHLYWTDRSVTRTRVASLGEHQMINHLPGMSALTSKSQLAANLRKMQEMHAEDYDFMPQSWLLPEDHAAFKRECRHNKTTRSGAMYIVKPERGCQGRHIFLTDDADDKAIQKASWFGAMGGDALVAQQYIQNPFIFYSQPTDKGYKFDLRLYLVVTSCDPLRVFLYTDGLARFCTEPYSEATEGNKDWRYMHLTNFSLNKANLEKFSHRCTHNTHAHTPPPPLTHMHAHTHTHTHTRPQRLGQARRQGRNGCAVGGA
jgi:tubulin polyglutamylase TTLL6/13